DTDVVILYNIILNGHSIRSVLEIDASHALAALRALKREAIDDRLAARRLYVEHRRRIAAEAARINDRLVRYAACSCIGARLCTVEVQLLIYDCSGSEIICSRIDVDIASCGGHGDRMLDRSEGSRWRSGVRIVTRCARCV